MNDKTPAEAIEAATKFYADARHELATEMDALRAKLKAAQEEHRLSLIALLDQAANARVALEAAISDHRDQFVKPKTKQLHGIKVGFQKGKGKIEFADDDEDAVIKMIREKLKSKASSLIVKSESVSKDALRNLPADDLASIGVSIADCGDVVVIKAVDAQLDKLIKGLAADEEFGRDLLVEDRVL